MNAIQDTRRTASRWTRYALAAGLALGLLSGCGGGGGGGTDSGGGGTTTGGTTTGGTTTGGTTTGGTTTGGSTGGTTGGSTGGTTGGTTGGGASGTPSVHLAGLGPLSGSRVRVEVLNAPSLTIAETRTDAQGRFSLTLPPVAALDDTWVLVIVDEGVDTDANADGVPDATPTPFNGALRALVRSRWLRERSIAVSALSDALYLSVAGALNDVPIEAIERALDRGAYALLKADFDGDAAISYDDVLAFNASRPGDQGRLDFDYVATVLGPQTSDGTSLASKYHRGENRLGPAVDEAFGRIVKPSLPAPEQLPTVAITLKSGLGGSVTGPGLGGTVIGGSFGTYVLRMERTAEPMIITATPDANFVFSRWVGCPELVAGAPQSCRVIPNDTHVVTAQFAVAERRLAPGLVGELVLDAEAGRLGVSFASPTEMVLTARASDTEMRAIIDTLRADFIVYTGIFDRPQLRVDDRRNRGVVRNPDGGEDLYQGRYRVSDIALGDAYDAITMEMSEAPLTLEDITAITVDDPATGNARTIKLPHPLLRGYIPGPAPKAEVAARACPGRDAAYQYAADGSGRVETTCLDRAAKPITVGRSCAITERTVDLVDGRRYCVLDGGSNSALYRHARELAAELAQAEQSGRLLKVASSAANANKPQGKSAPIQQPTFGREVFLAGYGRAYDLGRGQYLTNNPDAAGLSLLEIEGAPVTINDPKLLRRTVSATCRLNRFAAGCPRGRAAGLVKTQQIEPFPPIPGIDGIPLFTLNNIELSFPKIPALTITVRIQVNIDARNSGGGSYAAPLAGEVRMAGYVAVTPTLGVRLALSVGRDVLERSGRPIAGSSEKQEAMKRVFSIDFARYIPNVGAVMQGDVDFSIGFDITGGIEVDNQVQVPIITRYDVDAAAGLRCPDSIDLGLFSVPNPGSCTTTSKFDVVVRPSVQYRFRMQGRANVVLEPYAEVALTAGIKGGFERMARLGARGFLQGEAILESPIIQATNIPQIIAQQGGRRTCVDGGGEARINLYYGYRLYGQLTTADTLIGKIITLNRVFPFSEQKWPIAGWGWDLTTGEKLDPPKRTSEGLFVNPISDEPLPCTGGTRPKEPERTFRAGTLELQDGSFVATTSRQLVMQTDGNLVMYDYNADTATQGAARFASGTNGTFNLRAIFQPDGNLVIYNLRDQAVWRTGTFGYPNAVLRLQEDGELRILRADGDRPVWGQFLVYRNAGLVMRLGDRLLTPTRELVFQAHDGNLVLYRLENGFQREALWASGTGGMALGSSAYAEFQSDGNFVVYDNNGRARWASNSGGRGGNELWIQRDGNMVIYAPGDRALWSTGTGGR